LGGDWAQLRLRVLPAAFAMRTSLAELRYDLSVRAVATRVLWRSHVGGLRAAGVALVLAGLALSPRAAPAGEAHVRLEDGWVSATFVAAPFEQAFAEILRATGVEIVMPPSVRGGSLTLHADRESLDRFLQ